MMSAVGNETQTQTATPVERACVTADVQPTVTLFLVYARRALQAQTLVVCVQATTPARGINVVIAGQPPLRCSKAQYTRIEFIGSAAEAGYADSLSRCLFVCQLDWSKSYGRILTKFCEGVGHDPGSNGLDSGGDPESSVRSGLLSKILCQIWRSGVGKTDFSVHLSKL